MTETLRRAEAHDPEWKHAATMLASAVVAIAGDLRRTEDGPT